MIFSASLRVRHPTWSADSVCDYVKLTPKFIHDIGKERTTPTGQILDGYYSATYVSFSLYSSDEISFEDFFNMFISDGLLKNKNFSAIRESGGSAEILFGVSIHDNEWISLEMPHIDCLNKMRLEVQFDVYTESHLDKTEI